MKSLLDENKLGLKGELISRAREVVTFVVETLTREVARAHTARDKGEVNLNRLRDELKNNFDTFKQHENRTEEKYFSRSDDEVLARSRSQIENDITSDEQYELATVVRSVN
jgi:hypothetical protein